MYVHDIYIYDNGYLKQIHMYVHDNMKYSASHICTFPFLYVGCG